MCDACGDPLNSHESPRRRPLLAELNANWHCTIIGTCLSMSELRSAAAKFNIRFPKPNPTDYEVHAGMIRLLSQERSVAKTLHKMLDRKHALALARFKRAVGVADLEALWLDSLDKGDVAGACWALMSHAAATEELRSTLFGEIHMLSHQVGASARADIRRLHVLEKEKAVLEAKVLRQQERMAGEIGARETALRELRQRLDHEMAESRRLAHAASAASEISALRAMVSELQRHLSLETEGRRVAEAVARETERHAVQQAEEIEALRADRAETRDEMALLEAQFGAVLDGAGIEGDGLGACGPSCRRTDLCGRCILFVGGRAGQVQHMRRIVEECNGTMVHHDGGFEEGIGRLSGLFGQADAVMFPVDCVSHMAHDQIKRLCKRWEKPFVPVRRSGLGAFVRALEAVGQAHDPM